MNSLARRYDLRTKEQIEAEVSQSESEPDAIEEERVEHQEKATEAISVSSQPQPQKIDMNALWLEIKGMEGTLRKEVQEQSQNFKTELL